MCFSAGASFLASGGIAAVGAGSLHQAKKKRGLMAIALIPMLFSIQQLLEGAQWLVDKPSFVSSALAYGFLFFAFVIWPTYCPLAVYANETDKHKKSLLLYMGAVGSFVSLVLLGVLVTQPLSVLVIDHHIVYDVFIPYALPFGYLYGAVVVGSFLLSSHRYLRIFSVAIFISYVVSGVMYEQAFMSVWCFAAAALSILLLGFIYEQTHGSWWKKLVQRK